MRTLTIALVALLAGSAALAQPPGGAAGGLPANDVIFERNDANDDGEITLAEAQAAETALGQNFATFDLNSDGKVVAEELNTVRGRMGGAGPGGAAPGGAGRAGGQGAGPGAGAAAGASGSAPGAPRAPGAAAGQGAAEDDAAEAE